MSGVNPLNLRAFGAKEDSCVAASMARMRPVHRRYRCVPRHTSRLCTTAASMNEENSGCGSNGRDFSSGWNWTPMNQG